MPVRVCRRSGFGRGLDENKWFRTRDCWKGGSCQAAVTPKRIIYAKILKNMVNLSSEGGAGCFCGTTWPWALLLFGRRCPARVKIGPSPAKDPKPNCEAKRYEQLIWRRESGFSHLATLVNALFTLSRQSLSKRCNWSVLWRKIGQPAHQRSQ